MKRLIDKGSSAALTLFQPLVMDWVSKRFSVLKK